MSILDNRDELLRRAIDAAAKAMPVADRGVIASAVKVGIATIEAEGFLIVPAAPQPDPRDERIKELTDAVRPFAQATSSLAQSYLDADMQIALVGPDNVERHFLATEDFVRASAALKRSGTP